MAHTNQVIERLEELSLESKDAEDAARRFIATPERLDLARCREALSQAREREGELENLIAESSAQRKNMVSVRQLDQPAGRYISVAAIRRSTRRRQEALASLDSAGLSSELRAAILEMESEERRVLGERTAWQERTVALSRILFVVASAFSLVLIVIAGWRMTSEQKKTQRHGAGPRRKGRAVQTGRGAGGRHHLPDRRAGPLHFLQSGGAGYAAFQPRRR